MRDRGVVMAEVRALVPQVAVEWVDSHFSGLDDAYFASFPSAAVAQHVVLSSRLDGDRPVAVHLERQGGDGPFELTVVAFDYFGEFAIICGVLAAAGLDIQSGEVFTCRPARMSEQPRRGAGRRPQNWTLPRIVDSFVVAPQGGAELDAAAQERVAHELVNVLRLVGSGSLTEARDHVNRRLAERLESLAAPATRVLYPVEVVFDAVTDPRWTVMDVRSEDTPAFLYALANALSLRGVYIHRVDIESQGHEVQDRFYIGDRDGNRIEDPLRREQLRITVGVIKQFTHFLPAAPDPATAIRHFDQLVDKVLESGRGEGDSARLLDHLDGLAHLLGSSRFLWEDFLRMQWENLGPLLEHVDAPDISRGRQRWEQELASALGAARTYEERRSALNAFKDREMFLIDLRQLRRPGSDLTEFSTALTDLAEVVLAGALRVCGEELRTRHGWPRDVEAREVGFAAFGLGKFGGGELGYASDIELLYVYGGEGMSDGLAPLESAVFFEELVRSISGFIEARQHGIFEIDLRLRPYGRKGPFASSVAQMASYYRAGGEAAPFERQALTKLRWVAGCERVREAVESIRDRFVYGPEPWDRATALHLRWRQTQELARRGAINVKYGPGGLIDVEYTAQYLQIQHGHHWPDVRTPNTLVALDRLRARGSLVPEDHDMLCAAYVFLRRVIDGLRMVRGDAKDLELPDAQSEELKFLARRLGRVGPDWTAAARDLVTEIQRHMGGARSFYERTFGTPGPARDSNRG